MNIFKVIAGLTIHSGLLLLTAKQAHPRRHVLAAQPERFKAFKFKAADLKLMGVEKADDLGMYEVTGTTQFKVGEVIGFAGDVNKQLLEFLAPAGDEPEPAKNTQADNTDAAEKQAALHAAIFTAIGQLDPSNPEHFANGKPVRDAVSKIVGKKFKATDLDAAFADYQAAGAKLPTANFGQDVVDALIALDTEDDNVSPRREVIAQMVGREVSAEELTAAIDHLNAKDAGAGAE